MRRTPTTYATMGTYILLGASTIVITVCRAIEAGNYWMKTPKDRMKGR